MFELTRIDNSVDPEDMLSCVVCGRTPEDWIWATTKEQNEHTRFLCSAHRNVGDPVRGLVWEIEGWNSDGGPMSRGNFVNRVLFRWRIATERGGKGRRVGARDGELVRFVLDQLVEAANLDGGVRLAPEDQAMAVVIDARVQRAQALWISRERQRREVGDAL